MRSELSDLLFAPAPWPSRLVPTCRSPLTPGCMGTPAGETDTVSFGVAGGGGG